MKPLTSEQLEPALERITERLAAWGASKVVLFGSVARGDHRGCSDIDLLVVKETEDGLMSRIEQVLEICDRAAAPLPVEPLVYTPGELEGLLEAGNPLVTRALRQGRVLHEQPRA